MIFLTKKSRDFFDKKSFDFNHDLNQWLKSARFKSANPAITIVSLLVVGKYVSKVSRPITIHEQKTPYSVDGKPSWSELESGFQLGSNLVSQYYGSDVLTYHYTNILD